MKRNETILKIILVVGLLGIVLVANNPFRMKNTPTDKIEKNSTGTAEYLFDLKIPYIGNNSTVARLISVLDIGMYGKYTFELKTSEKPYALIINYNLIEGWGNIFNHPETVTEKSALLLALIDNVDEIGWVLPDSDEVHKITTEDLFEKYGNIKEYGKSVESLNELLIKLGYYEEENPITMSIKDLSDTGLTLMIENHTENRYSYGEAFNIEYKKDGKWINVEEMSYVFTSIGYTLTENQISERKCSWKIKLSSGEYRITKEFDQVISESDYKINFGKKYIVSIEFTI